MPQPRVLRLPPNARNAQESGSPRMTVADLLKVWDVGVDESSPGWLVLSGDGEEVVKALDALDMEPLGPPLPHSQDDGISVARVRLEGGVRQATKRDVVALKGALGGGI